ncbi:uncharacterized protein LOC108227831 [Daucus carota subsp. sativus]|uniref:uncharacterized protein LOC108227831 n=1 Tax=Daucus carota subsp. sativus TaxID=79200 RepID=UPI0007EF0A62|nr:PREDICTED: uncharacterized protein LOC108227831 [Daucus carota subsp. sativus]
MDHFSHEHPLILNEDYIARGPAEMCNACNEEIVSCKSFVFSCSRSSITGFPRSETRDVDEKCLRFFLHKTCAELPRRIESPRNREEFLDLHIIPRNKHKLNHRILGGQEDIRHCDMCEQKMSWNYCTSELQFCVCLQCAMSQVDSLRSHKFKHQSHSQHPLALIQRPSSFKCDACDVEDDTKDMSYKCVDCPFWMHKSCADAPTSFLFSFHDKHPLILSFSLPQAYQKFKQYCRICDWKLNRSNWLYYCSKCRFFAHFQCARARQHFEDIFGPSEDKEYPDLVHLPAATESSVNLLFEQFIKDMSRAKNEEGCSTRRRLKDWAHGEHQLHLVTVDELNHEKAGDDVLFICDACVKPIRNDGDLFYACVPCKYFLHKSCGELFLPTTNYQKSSDTMLYYKYSQPHKLFLCYGCTNYGNGLSFRRIHPRQRNCLNHHIRCSALPERIKHESHHHVLDFQSSDRFHTCKACGESAYTFRSCEDCDFRICLGCVMKASRVKHRWDPHPLRLIYDPGMVEDHEHEYECEFCSEELDTNFWFYHCNRCDLSFHLRCYEKSCFLDYSTIKFGATDIVEDQLHHHGLTFVFNKKVRRCGICKDRCVGQPVLECAPCRIIFCQSCS